MIKKINFNYVFVILFLILFTLHILFLYKPISRDAGAYLTIASGILKGKLPYVDYFDHKPPGIYYCISFFLSIGKTIYAAKIGTMLFNIMTAITLFFIGKKFWNKEIGALSSIFYLAGLLVYEGYYVLTEPFLAFFSSLAVLCFISHLYNRSFNLLFLSGLMIGLSTLFKQTGVLMLLGIFLFYCFKYLFKELNLKNAIKDSFVVFCGFLLPILLTLFYFYSVNALKDLYFCVITVNLYSYKANDIITFLYNNYNNLFHFPLLWILSISGLITIVNQCFKSKNIKNKDKEFFLSIMVIFSMIPLLIRQYGHYYIQILPFATLLGSYMIVSLKEPIRSILKSEKLKVVIVFTILVLITPTLKEICKSAYGVIYGLNLNCQINVADYIKSHTKPDEKIFVIVAQPEYYFLSNREPMNKNIYLLPINLNNTYTIDGIIKELKNKKIKYIIVVNHSIMDKVIKKLYIYIHKNYLLEKEFKFPLTSIKVKIYRLKKVS